MMHGFMMHGCLVHGWSREVVVWVEEDSKVSGLAGTTFSLLRQTFKNEVRAATLSFSLSLPSVLTTHTFSLSLSLSLAWVHAMGQVVEVKQAGAVRGKFGNSVESGDILVGINYTPIVALLPLRAHQVTTD